MRAPAPIWSRHCGMLRSRDPLSSCTNLFVYFLRCLPQRCRRRIANHAAAIDLPPEFAARTRHCERALSKRRGSTDRIATSVANGFSVRSNPAARKPELADAYEIGSTTRSFTGLLFAEALLDGKLRLDDTLGKVISGMHFADRRLAAATIAQLADAPRRPARGAVRICFRATSMIRTSNTMRQRCSRISRTRTSMRTPALTGIPISASRCLAKRLRVRITRTIAACSPAMCSRRSG